MLPPIFQILTGDAAVAAIVGDRVYPHDEAPQDVGRPYVTWFVVAGPPELVLDGPPPMDRFTLQVDCWSPTSAGVLSLAAAVRDALERHAHITNQLANRRDPETRLYRYGFELDYFLSR